MADFAASLSDEHGVAVIDGVVSAVAMCEAMVRLKMRTSRLGGHTPPRASVSGEARSVSA